MLRLLLFLAIPLHASYGADKTYDIVVYGGSSAGFTAAIQAAQMGKSVALIEPGARFGGMNVEGLGGSDIDNHKGFQNSPAVGGLALEFYRRLAAHYGKAPAFEAMLQGRKKIPALWRFEPSAAEAVILTWLKQHRIDLIPHAPLIETAKAVRKNGPRIEAIVTEQGSYQAQVFIDATIEGDLLAAAEVSTLIGREPNQLYNETKNGIRHHTSHCQFAVRVDPWNTPGDPASGPLPGIFDEPLGEDGAGDQRLQAYCYRVCLTNRPENRLPLPKPASYDRANYELHLRYLRAGGKLYRPQANIPNQKTDFNGGRDLSHNLNGMNHGYPAGSRAERLEILDHHRGFTQGLFWFLATDPEVGQLDPELQQAWSQWGLPKDEFTDNAGWPRQFYVRDARRLISDYVITEHHVKKQNPTPVEDPVAVACWPPDVHNVRTIVKDGHAWNEGFVFGGDEWIPFGISYRALIPKAAEATNLLAPACPSSSHIAYGAIRIEFTFMALGQACATAAVQAIDSGLPVQKLPYPALRERLLQDNQVIDLPR